jgi:hypothetical protein
MFAKAKRKMSVGTRGDIDIGGKYIRELMPHRQAVPEISNDPAPSISILKLSGTFAVTFFLTQFFIFSILYLFNINIDIITNPVNYASHKALILIFQALFHLGIYTFRHLPTFILWRIKVCQP